MTGKDITSSLENIACAEDFFSASRELTDSWTAADVGTECIEPILRFMESHPALEYGAPGPLVHFVETFDECHDEKLVESVNRQPTMMNVWMLNRVINVSKGKKRKNLLATMEYAAKHNNIDQYTLDRINDFLER